MANIGVKGTIVDAETEIGIKGLEIVAVDLDPIFREATLNEKPVLTDQKGSFEISYSPEKYSQWYERKPDIVVRIYGLGVRLLHETPEISDVDKTILDLSTIEIHRANIEGWLTTNSTINPSNPILHTKVGPEKGAPISWTRGNRVEILKDGATLFPQLTEAVDRAKVSINFMNLMFQVDGNLITKFKQTFVPSNPQIGVKVKGDGLHEILKRKASTLTSTNVLVWDFPFIDAPDTFDEVKKYFLGTKVNVRGSSSFPSFMHAKTVIIDHKIAFVIGSVIKQSYFNDKHHLIHDARHSGSLTHDMSLKVSGPVVEHIDRTFAIVWNASNLSGPKVTPATNQSSEDVPGIGVQVVRTLPGGIFDSSITGEALQHGETGVLEAYQRAIANAKKYIYIEDQYLTAPEIFTSLLHTMKKTPDLEIIIVINPKPDVEGYPEKQIRLIKELKRSLEKSIGEANVKNRLGIFTLWSCDETKSPFEIMPIYVHSKAAIIDDLWATIGSANLDGASLNQIDWPTISMGKFKEMAKFGWSFLLWILLLPIAGSYILASRFRYDRPTQHANPGQDEQPTRSTELNLVICDKNPTLSHPNESVVELRKDLWREHLGYETDLPGASEGLEVWRQRAAEKLESIKQRKYHPAKILEWKPEKDSDRYLNALGIKTKSKTTGGIKKYRIRGKGKADKFDFGKGTWK